MDQVQKPVEPYDEMLHEYQDGKFMVTVHFNPNGKSFQEGIEEYFRACLRKEFGV